MFSVSQVAKITRACFNGHKVDTVGVAGSIPVEPTITNKAIYAGFRKKPGVSGLSFSFTHLHEQSRTYDGNSESRCKRGVNGVWANWCVYGAL